MDISHARLCAGAEENTTIFNLSAYSLSDQDAAVNSACYLEGAMVPGEAGYSLPLLVVTPHNPSQSRAAFTALADRQWNFVMCTAESDRAQIVMFGHAYVGSVEIAEAMGVLDAIDRAADGLAEGLASQQGRSTPKPVSPEIRRDLRQHLDRQQALLEEILAT